MGPKVPQPVRHPVSLFHFLSPCCAHNHDGSQLSSPTHPHTHHYTHTRRLSEFTSAWWWDGWKEEYFDYLHDGPWADEGKRTSLEICAAASEPRSTATSLKVMQVLLDAGADPNAASWFDASAAHTKISGHNALGATTPLMLAVDARHLGAVTLLLQYGARLFDVAGPRSLGPFPLAESSTMEKDQFGEVHHHTRLDVNTILDITYHGELLMSLQLQLPDIVANSSARGADDALIECETENRRALEDMIAHKDSRRNVDLRRAPTLARWEPIFGGCINVESVAGDLLCNDPVAMLRVLDGGIASEGGHASHADALRGSLEPRESIFEPQVSSVCSKRGGKSLYIVHSLHE